MPSNKKSAATVTPDARHAAAAKSLAALGVKLKRLHERLAASHKHAADDPDHLPQTEAFLRDVDLKVDEIVAWINRSLPAK